MCTSNGRPKDEAKAVGTPNRSVIGERTEGLLALRPGRMVGTDDFWQTWIQNSFVAAAKMGHIGGHSGLGMHYCIKDIRKGMNA